MRLVRLKCHSPEWRKAELDYLNRAGFPVFTFLLHQALVNTPAFNINNSMARV